MVRQRMMVLRTLILSLTLSFEYVLGQEVVILDEYQKVNGTFMTTRKGRTISAYLGIPYAEPPIGKLRFRNTIPYKPRDGDIRAYTHSNPCPQLDNNGVVIGDEDCLYLNVYTPEASPEIPYPVMVYFHGGDFVRGSSMDGGPEYLLDKDIVLVTVNYRLGVLGFLSTGDAASPGNFGLKDQTVALKWVREYILGFGGHYHQVTIFGQDAGGASTVLLSMSPTSQDHFDQFISQSGSPLAHWSFADELYDDYQKYAKYLGNYLNCPTKDSFALVECLRSLDPSTLVDTNDIFKGNEVWRYRTWSPTIEPKGMSGAFLTMKPSTSSVVLHSWMKDCPAIIGSVMDEGLLWTAAFYTNSTIYDSIAGDLDAFLVPLVDSIAGDGHPERTAEKVKRFYFGSANVTDKETFTHNMTNLMGDIDFYFPITFQTWMMGFKNAPYYMYKFGYRGTYSRTSDVIGNNDDIGVTHNDDLTYFFPLKNATIKLSESDEKMIDIMVDFWTSFASGGAPTSQHISDPNMWIPYKPEEQSLVIGQGSDPLAMSFESPAADIRLIFWTHTLIGELFQEMAIQAP